MNEHIALVAGSTGLIGNLLVRNLLEDQYFSTIVTLGRRESSIKHDKLQHLIIDFGDLSSCKEIPKGDSAFCCLGTTMKKAGSKAAFYTVDYTYVLNFAKFAFSIGCRQFHLVSAMGADQKSLFYYNQVKGQIEEAIREVGFDVVHIMRPSLLLGDREETRIGESIGQLFANTFSFLIPDNYKGIHGASVANYMQELAKKPQSGIYIHESAEIRRNVN